jgi:hypothetical protein
MRMSTHQTIFNSFVIYVDSLGTKSLIRERDKIYQNRIGFYEMVALYFESYDVFHSVFKNGVIFFGFSDTIIAVPRTNDIDEIAIASSKVFTKLLGYSLATRIYVTYGDFSYHRLEDISDKPDTFVCPVYGSTILDADEMDQSSIRCLGVFVHPTLINEFKIIDDVRFTDGKSAGFLDLNYYLTSKEITDLIEMINASLTIENVGEKSEQLKKEPSIISLIDLLQQHQIPMDEIDRTINDIFSRINANKKALLTYYTALQEALLNRNVIVKREKKP